MSGYPSPRYAAVHAGSLTLDAPLGMYNLPLASAFAAQEGADGSVVTTALSARQGAKAYAGYKGRDSIYGGTLAGQTLEGAGAAEWFGPGGKQETSTASYFIATAAMTIDRLYVWLSAAPASGGTVRCVLTLNDIDTGMIATIGAGATLGSTRQFPVQVAPGQRVNLRVETTSGVQANAIGLSFGLGTMAAQTDASFFACTTPGSSAVAVTKPAGVPLYTEVPPWFLTVPQLTDRAFLATTENTYLCRTTSAANAGAIAITAATKLTDVEAGTSWAYSYNGAYAASTLNPSTSSQAIALAMHGENKNERFVDAQGKVTYKQNTVAPSIPASSVSSGYNPDGSYSEGYGAYFAFVSARFMASSSANGWVGATPVDIGPIAWPQAGYLTAQGALASNGVGQPTFLQDGGYLYCYYRDSSPGSDGIKVVRAPVATAQDPTTWRIYTADTGVWSDAANWVNPSLPAGFTAATAANFYAVPGSPGTPIAQHHQYAGRIAVAAVRNSNPKTYIGVQEFSPDGSTWLVQLMVGNDPINLVPVATLQQGAQNGAGFLNYPILCDQYGSGHEIVDAATFFVLGSEAYTTTPQRMLITGAGMVQP